MVDFNKNLTQEQTAVPAEVAPIVDRSSEHIAKAVKSAVGGVHAVQTENIKKEFVEGVTEITNQENEFLREQKRLEDELITSKDKAVIDDVQDKLMRLERGEKAGALNPLEAETRRRSLLSQAVTLNPWLASDFKALAAATKGSGSSKGVGGPTPEQIAMDERRKRAISNGISLSRQTEMDQQDFVISRQQQAVAASAAGGTLVFPQARMSNANNARIQAQNIIGQAYDMLKQDPKAIDQTDWVALVNNSKSMAKRHAMQMEVELSKSGKTLSPTDRDRLSKDIEDEMAIAEQFVKSKDKLAYLERVRKTIENEGVITMSQMNPYFSAMVANGAEDKAWDLAFRIWPEYTAAVQRHGSYDQIKLMAENLGDPDAIAFVQAVEFNDAMYAKGLYNKIRAGGQPKSFSESMLLNGMAASIIKTPNVKDDADLGPTSDKAHDLLLSGDSPEGELDHYLDPQVFKNTINDGKVMTKLNTAVQFREENTVISAPRTLHTAVPGTDKVVKTHSVIYDRSSKSFKVMDHRDLILQKSDPGRDINLTMTATTTSLTRLLNVRTMYDMFGKISREQYIQEVLDAVNQEVQDD